MVGRLNRSGGTSGLGKPKTLEQLGISDQQSSDWQKLAAVPKDEFEAALAMAEMTSARWRVPFDHKRLWKLPQCSIMPPIVARRSCRGNEHSGCHQRSASKKREAEQTKTPDLHELVSEGRYDVNEPLGALNVREEKARAEAAASATSR